MFLTLVFFLSPLSLVSCKRLGSFRSLFPVSSVNEASSIAFIICFSSSHFSTTTYNSNFGHSLAYFPTLHKLDSDATCIQIIHLYSILIVAYRQRGLGVHRMQIRIRPDVKIVDPVHPLFCKKSAVFGFGSVTDPALPLPTCKILGHSLMSYPHLTPICSVPPSAELTSRHLYLHFGHDAL